MRAVSLTLGLAALAAPLAAQDYHFTREIPAGGRVEIENISGPIEVSRASGRMAEITVTKTVKRGDGSLVKAVEDNTGNRFRVCTVYLTNPRENRSCSDNSNNHHGDELRVEMHYVVRVPAEAHLVVENVNGNVTVTGAGAESQISTVNGDVNFEGIGASTLETVNGSVHGRLDRADWEGTMHVETVNGSAELTLPAELNADVRGETVNGNIESQFRITVEGKWGPKSFEGRIGTGGRRITIETVNGNIVLNKRP